MKACDMRRELNGYLSLETYNGRFTALVNKYFLLNNIREKRDDARCSRSITLRVAQLAELSAKPRRESEREREREREREGREGGRYLVDVPC